MSKVLIVMDIQNDYFPGGKFPLWNTDATLTNIENAIQRANDKDIPVVLIQHIADSSSPFLNEGTEGADIHPTIKKVAPNAKIIKKAFADGFYQTKLESILTELGATELLICGMMTQNCVTHTAISKTAEKYDVKILSDCCTTVNEMIHLIALRAVSTRVCIVPSTEEF
ncbi:cysteine hydrolase family protein [Bacillus sp. AFS055030]|uniref:cysteine hydrolase family protein n=1 Tax=Bacillus sp. AFS055030 TaxID=2033507 RepID=UPI000BFC8106|nr:cysteine hydrolase family protein [Bacillus sp. AFS055030]PGL67849.1 cysteine hydrolase [Bacillus sp. AFS055030]